VFVKTEAQKPPDMAQTKPNQSPENWELGIGNREQVQVEVQRNRKHAALANGTEEPSARDFM